MKQFGTILHHIDATLFFTINVIERLKLNV